MATIETIPVKRQRRWRRYVALAVVVVLLAALAWFWKPLNGRAIAAASFGARMGCSCRYIEGRSLDSCKADFEPGMSLVSLSEDTTEKSVSAKFPLLARQTAFYREGEGCVLERWSD